MNSLRFKRAKSRELALGQMRKGTMMFSKYHSDALADEIFTYIHTVLAPQFSIPHTGD